MIDVDFTMIWLVMNLKSECKIMALLEHKNTARLRSRVAQDWLVASKRLAV